MELTFKITRMGSDDTEDGKEYHAVIQLVPDPKAKMKCGGSMNLTRQEPFDGSYAFGKTVTVTVSETAS